MNKIEPKLLKGFRDFLPKSIKKRELVINALKQVFISFGFEPLETPALEYEEVLTGKYGGEGEKLMYRFEDNGKRRVALRYDQTVPLARVIAKYQNEIPMPFKRYQIQNVWRAENTQKGRYREFLQVDADIVGSYSPLADAEIIAICYKGLKALGFKNYKILINDRTIFQNLKESQSISDEDLPILIRSLDKLKKVGEQKVIEELISNGFNAEKANSILLAVKAQKPSTKILEILSALEKMGVEKEYIEFTPTLARGLDYYTGIIFEAEDNEYSAGSLAGGGRYDNLIGVFSNNDYPAVGISFGFDRIIEAMDELNLFPNSLNENNIFVAFSNPDLQEKSLEIATSLRNKGLIAELFLEDTSLEKQLKYADKKNIPFVIIVEENSLILKDMNNKTQENLPLEEIVKKFKN